MAAFRRRTVEPTPAPVAVDMPAYVDRALIILTTKIQTCLERLDTLETRMDELADQLMHAPSHSDILEVRMHSAKLAAEMARSTVELRGEIGMAAEESRRIARAAQQPHVDPAIETPNLDLIHIEEPPFSATA